MLSIRSSDLRIMAIVLLFILITAVATWGVVDAVRAMHPTNYPASCEVGLLNGTYSECPQ